MEFLESALTGKKLDDLRVAKVAGGSNLIEPTKAEIESIIVALKEGKSYQEIKRENRREVGAAKLGFSSSQIRRIDAGRHAKIADLTPKPKEVELI